MSDEDAKSWIYAGGIPYELSEGDIVCVFSQYGEILEISLSRDKETGKSRGFGFLKFEDPRSCELAVDNLNGAAIVGRKIKVSFANNVNALKAKKPAIVAPSETNALPQVDSIKKRDYKESRERHQDTPSLSPSPSPSPRRHKRSKHSHRESIEKRHKSRHRNSPSPKRHKSSSSKHSHRDSKGKHHKSKHHSHSRSPRRDSKHRKHSKHK